MSSSAKSNPVLMKFFMFMFSSLLRIKHEITTLVAREVCGGPTLDMS
jgi:hypothetical protein